MARQSIEHTEHDSGPIAAKKIDDIEKMRRFELFTLEDPDCSVECLAGLNVSWELGRTTGLLYES